MAAVRRAALYDCLGNDNKEIGRQGKMFGWKEEWEEDIYWRLTSGLKGEFARKEVVEWRVRAKIAEKHTRRERVRKDKGRMLRERMERGREDDNNNRLVNCRLYLFCPPLS